MKLDQHCERRIEGVRRPLNLRRPLQLSDRPDRLLSPRIPTETERQRTKTKNSEKGVEHTAPPEKQVLQVS